MKSVLIAAAMCLLNTYAVYGQTVITPSNLQVEKYNPGKMDRKDQQEEEQLELAKDLILKQKRIIQEIPNTDNYTTFTLDFLSRFDTRILIEWSDDNIDYRGKSGQRYRLNKNSSRGFTFIAFAETKGTIRILNDAGELIMTIPYVVKAEKKGRHNVGFNASTKIGDLNPRLRVNYSHSRTNKDGGRWSFRTSASGTLDDIENINLNLGVNYSW